MPFDPQSRQPKSGHKHAFCEAEQRFLLLFLEKEEISPSAVLTFAIHPRQGNEYDRDHMRVLLRQWSPTR
jgi:hypothetical protein